VYIITLHTICTYIITRYEILSLPHTWKEDWGKRRVEEQQGYYSHEYDIIMESDDIDLISEQEVYLQKMYGYRVDERMYNELKFNNKNEMNINITEQTTTFPCPINKLKGQLMDDIGFKWKTEHGECMITSNSIDWIMANVQTSRV
jgi:hypothetical protein